MTFIHSVGAIVQSKLQMRNISRNKLANFNKGTVYFGLKVWELTANKVIMVSAIGNDGPLYG